MYLLKTFFKREEMISLNILVTETGWYNSSQAVGYNKITVMMVTISCVLYWL